jgi:hypothetical protein
LFLYQTESLMKIARLFLTFATCFTLTASATVRYVDVASTNATPPYTDWATAAAVIQDAVDVAEAGDTVLVTNGVYRTGSRVAGTSMTNRVAAIKAVHLQSANGPAVTVIEGNPLPYGMVLRQMRCVYLTNGATLTGFTLTNGLARSTEIGGGQLSQNGGGIYCTSASATVSNCVVTSCGAGVEGGGIYGGTLLDCTLTNNYGPKGGAAAYSKLIRCRILSNSAYDTGGGAYYCNLDNCTVVGNQLEGDSGSGGGASYCLLNNCTVLSNSVSLLAPLGGGGTLNSTQYNCIVYFNRARTNDNYASSGRGIISVLENCCAMPLPTNGAGNFSNAPLFLNLANGDFHLQPGSPCINAGDNAYATTLIDLDGLPRISGGTVDLGAFELQNPATRISIFWLQQYGLATDGSADETDPDGDGMSNWKEWRCDTDPANTLSALRVMGLTKATTGLRITWQSAPTRSYWIERATNLSAPSFSIVANRLPGAQGSTSFSDLSATNGGPYFYRIGAQP